MSLRKIIKNRGSFPTDEAALNLLYLGTAEYHSGVDDAGQRLARSTESLCDYL